MLGHVLCFYSYVCNLYLPPSLNFTKIWMRNRILNSNGLRLLLFMAVSNHVVEALLLVGRVDGNHFSSKVI